MDPVIRLVPAASRPSGPVVNSQEGSSADLASPSKSAAPRPRLVALPGPTRLRVEAEGPLLNPARATISSHARKRATELGFTLEQVLRCISSWEQSYVCHPRHGPGRRTYQLGKLAVILHEPSNTIVTVLLRQQDRWIHGAA